MKKKSRKILKVSVGISAYNEAANIVPLLQNILKQKELGYQLTEIVVISDGSSDQTPELVRAIRDVRIRLLDKRKRLGQPERQNQILRQFIGEVIVFMEADTLLKDEYCLANLIKPFHDTHVNKLGMVFGIPIAVPPSNRFERIMVHAGQMKFAMFTKWKEGNNLYRSGGHAMKALAREFAETLTFPPHTPEDSYAYLWLKHTGWEMRIAENARVYMRHVTNFSDRLRQCRKYRSGRRSLTKYFDSKYIDKEYKIPNTIQLLVFAQFLCKQPVLTILVLLETIINQILTYNSKSFTALHETYSSTKTLVEQLKL